MIILPTANTLLSIVIIWKLIIATGSETVVDQVTSPSILTSQSLNLLLSPSLPPQTMFTCNDYNCKMFHKYLLIITCNPCLLMYLEHPCSPRAVLRLLRSSTQPLISYLCTVDTVQHPPVSKNQSPSSIRHGWSWSTKPDLKIVITLLSSKSFAFKVCTHNNFAGLCFVLTLIFASVWTSQQIHHHQWVAQ